MGVHITDAHIDTAVCSQDDLLIGDKQNPTYMMRTLTKTYKKD